ncbi:MAG: SdiA-regulated domain-containing protein [Lewinellaceae bacterium]|nr:SdiA-regulated domain-containing protein [Lewinellaceae bacterium]
MNFGIKEAFILCVFLVAGTLLSYTYISGVFMTAGYSTGSTQGYDFSNPANIIELPEILHEISGLTDIDNHTIACVQDEEGIVFIYDLRENKIRGQFKFNKDGDYEGITRAGNSLYILRSDGKLYEVDNYKNKDFQTEEYDMEIPVKDNEGLAYDPQNNRLLIAGKSEPKSDDYKDKRLVFAFDLNTKSAVEKPIYEFSEEQIRQFVLENNSGLSKKDKEPGLKINPSGISVHPVTRKLFVLSSKDNLIYIFNQDSQVEAVHHLNKKIFNQPEGITFLDNGDMLISNEGGKGAPTLLLLPYKE